MGVEVEDQSNKIERDFTIVFDGSNVARDNESKTASINAVIHAKTFFIDQGINPENIHIIFGSRIRHILKKDEESLFDKIMDEPNINSAPKGINDDQFIISLALDKDAYILSNDCFEDHIEKNPELKTFITSHLIKYMILDGDSFFLSYDDMKKLDLLKKIKIPIKKEIVKIQEKQKKNTPRIHATSIQIRRNPAKNKSNRSKSYHKTRNTYKSYNEFQKKQRKKEKPSSIYKETKVLKKQWEFIKDLNQMLSTEIPIIDKLGSAKLGLKIDQGNIVELFLVGQEIQVFPDSFASLTELKVLNLEHNQIPHIPKIFYDLKKIVDLNLSYNKFKHFPEAIDYLKSLEFLSLDHNMIETLPNSVAILKNLRNFNISNNNISEISNSIFYLQHLRVLNISHNKIKTYPDSFSKLYSLVMLDFSHNKLTEINEFLSHLLNLRILNIKHNPVKIIDESIFNMENLSQIQMSKDIKESLSDVDTVLQHKGMIKFQ